MVRRLSVMGFIAPVLCVSLLLSSCASVKPVQEGIVRMDVPFFEQEDYQCGPAALAAVLNYWFQREGKGRTTTPGEIVREIFSPSARGVLGLDLELYARKQGFRVHSFRGTIEDLCRHAGQGVPLIILADYGFAGYQRNHFMVVTGCGDRVIMVHSGRKANQTITHGELERIWKRAGSYTLSVTP